MITGICVDLSPCLKSRWMCKDSAMLSFYKIWSKQFLTSPQENGAAKWKSPIAGEGEREHKHVRHWDKADCCPKSANLFGELHLHCLGHQGCACWSFLPLVHCSGHKQAALAILAHLAVSRVTLHRSRQFEGNILVLHQISTSKLLPHSYSN